MLLSSSNIVGCLSVLCEVESSNFFSFLNLLLVRLDLALQLIDQSLHTLVVLSVLILLISELLDLALGLTQVLLGIRAASRLSIKLRLKLTDSCIHSCHGLLSSFKSIGLSLIYTSL